MGWKINQQIHRYFLRWIGGRLHCRAHLDADPASNIRYRLSGQAEALRLPIRVLFRADGPTGVTHDAAIDWCRRQTVRELYAEGRNVHGKVIWEVGRAPTTSECAFDFWFAAPGCLPDVVPSHLESCLLVAAAESIDAVVLVHGQPADSDRVAELTAADDAHGLRARPWALYRSDAYEWSAESDEVRPRKGARVIKYIEGQRNSGPLPTNQNLDPFRLGPYLSTERLGSTMTIEIRDVSLLERSVVATARPTVLVLAPFLARGGAEQTLFATMNELQERFDFAIATLAPHRPHLGDRRSDFRPITPRLYSLGDLVHPDAMIGILLNLVDSLGATTVYNANGTTLFYDFAPRLKAERPNLRILDHLYDHRVGYVQRYDRKLLASVDACIAENHAIAKELVDNRGWPADRVPVIWPCGRAESDLPSDAERPAIRARLRAELDIDDSAVVFLTAARMHEQKRPLDLVALAERVHDLASVRFLIVGGGDLENAVDTAIANSRYGSVRRLPFREDILDVILAADVGVLVSEFEGLPVFLLECLQLGRPFVGTRVGDLGTVIDQTGAGLVVDRPGDLDALEAAVRRLSDPRFRQEAARRAAQAAPQFGVEACARAYERVFHGAE